MDTQQVQSTNLDDFLRGATHQLPASTGTVSADEMPVADKIVVVAMMVDDSGSIANAHLGAAVLEGLNLGVQALRGARSADYYLIVRGFKGTIFEGMLRSVQPDSFASYYPGDSSTPIVGKSIILLADARQRANRYRGMGVSASIAMLILTDGMPYMDTAAPSEFGENILPSDYIVGMGIAPDGDTDAEAKFRALFQSMGITRVKTPKDDPADVRHAMNEFSQSVASVVG